ncbi:unnamed protein product, partial [Scytosiphon promiscuus]
LSVCLPACLTFCANIAVLENRLRGKAGAPPVRPSLRRGTFGCHPHAEYKELGRGTASLQYRPKAGGGRGCHFLGRCFGEDSAPSNVWPLLLGIPACDGVRALPTTWLRCLLIPVGMVLMRSTGRATEQP